MGVRRLSLVVATLGAGTSALGSVAPGHAEQAIAAVIASPAGHAFGFFPHRVGHRRCVIPEGGPVLRPPVRGLCTTRVSFRRGYLGQIVVALSEVWPWRLFHYAGKPRRAQRHSWRFVVLPSRGVKLIRQRGDFPPQWMLAAAASRPAISPMAHVSVIEKMWRANLRSGAIADPKRRFPNPSRKMLTARLRRASERYHFSVVNVEILRPRQAAPFVVVTARDKRALAASTPAILRLIDPKARTGDDRTGWAYEGFLFEARDSHGVPFLATFNWWRGPHAGGGQWASDPSLYPFPHG